MKLATTTADMTGYTPDAYDLAAVLPLFAETGFRNLDVNFGNFGEHGGPLDKPGWQAPIERAGEAAAALGYRFVQAHSSDSVFEEGPERDFTREMIARQFRACRILGIPNMVVHEVWRRGNTWKEQREANRRFYRSLIPVLEETGVNLLIENGCRQNCYGMFYYVSSEFILTTLRDLGNHPLIHAVWDVGHAHLQGVDQYREIMELGDELRGVHIHDNMASADVHMAPYAGTLGYDAVLKGLVDANYRGYFTLEAYSIPTPASFLGRAGYILDDVVYDRLTSLPFALKQRSERLLYDTARFMLEQYNCYEE
ncbi:MAG: sugar phosphate isomerase/epimerase family protein [Anaerolineae bacterium]